VDGTGNVGVAAERNLQAAVTIDVDGSVKHLGELWRRSVMKTMIRQNTQPELYHLWNSQPVEFREESGYVF